MKRLSLFVCVFSLIIGTAYSQDIDGPVMHFDEAVSFLAGEIHSKLSEKRAEAIFIGQFTFQSSVPTFISYWINQLTDDLVNMRGRSYRVLSGNAQNADWTISGEIVQISNIIRVYTRLVRVSDRAIEGSFTSSFLRDSHISEMLSGSNSGGGSGGTSAASADPLEWDDWDSPVLYELGTDANVSVINRTLTEDDEDFFLIIPEFNGRLTAETTGSTDTYMFLYDYESEEELASNDDGGSNTNSRITYNVSAGVSYLVVVCGYNSSVTGPYGFRAYIARREGSSSFNSPISYSIGENEEEAATVSRTLQQGDEDYFLIVPDRDGRLTMETTGRTDTYMELFDADNVLLEHNDDGGSNTNARLRYNVRAGSRYVVKIRGYSQYTTGSYGFRAYFPGAVMLPPDEFEPNDEPASATAYTIGATQRHTFHTGNDIDWIRFQVTSASRYIINTRGVNNNRLDTYIELFDNSMNRIAEDDDGGDSLSSQLSLNLAVGVYFLKIWCLDEEPDQAYTLNIAAARN